MTDTVGTNAAAWDSRAAEFAGPGRRNWESNEPAFGIWDFPEAEVGFLGDVSGRDVVELGCGTAYVSSWIARRGGRPVGVDPSGGQLGTARALQAEFLVEFPLVQAGAESVPLPDSSFDLAVSEYGASIWADPVLWIPEAARLLRPGGRLVFLRSTPLLSICFPRDGSVPALVALQAPHFGGLGALEWPGEDGVEYVVSHGELIRLLVGSGFVVEELLELQAPEGGDPGRWDFVTLEWARQWPSEEIWKARKGA